MLESYKNVAEEDVKEVDKQYDNEDDYRTSVKDLDVDVGGENNTDSNGGSAEWLRFLIPRVRKEAFGAIAKAKASSLTSSRKKPSLEKVRIN